MDLGLPDDETVRAAIALALRAPSVHNSQPWRWRIGHQTVDLYADPNVHVLPTDPDRRDQILSCGTVLHHFRVAIAALGWQARVHRFPNPADLDHIASIELHLHHPSEQDIAMAAAIPRRRTDRRHFSSWPVPIGHIALMASRVAKEGVALYRTEAVPSREDADGDAAELLVLGTPSDDRMSQLRAGEATSAVLLTATVLGLASCILIEPLEVKETRDNYRSNVLDNNGFPQMLVRIGWASINADELPASPRHTVAEIVEALDTRPRKGPRRKEPV